MRAQHQIDELTHAVMSGGKSMTAYGIMAIVLGILAMLAPGLTGLSLSILLGLFVTVGGLLRIVWAFGASSLGKGLFTLALGTLTLLCGVLLVANPLIGSGVLTILLTVYFIVDGIFEIGAGFTLKGGGWLVFSGSISILLGLMIWAQYPLSGAWAMGTLLGIKLFLVGLVMIASGSAVRSLARA